MKKMTLFITVATGLGSNGHAGVVDELEKPKFSMTTPDTCKKCEVNNNVMSCECDYVERTYNWLNQLVKTPKQRLTTHPINCVNGFRNDNGNLACN